MSNQKQPTRPIPVFCICMGAISVALALALSYLEIDLWFQGGSISLVMIPLVLFSVRFGVGWGVLSGLALGTLKFFLAGGFAISWQSMLLDYTVAYAAVGLAGLAHPLDLGKPFAYSAGALLGGIARFFIHFLSGITIYAIIAPEELFGFTISSPILYSILYNGTYMLPSMILTVILSGLLSKPLKKLWH